MREYKKNDIKVSIIIPNYNGAEFIESCLLALEKQCFTDYEVMVVDNCSTDQSIDLIKKNHPNTKIISLSNNFGFSKAVNVGISQSRGKYVVLLNNDTIVLESWLKCLYECINKDKKIFSCSSKMIQFHNKNAIDDAGDSYTILGSAVQEGHGKSVDNYMKDRLVFSSCAGAAIYRKRIFEEIGYFDENFFAYLEDLDIGYRSRLYGYYNVFCSGAELYHIGSATTGGGFNPIKVKLSVRNNILLIYKNMPFIQLLLNLPFIVLGHFQKYLFYKKMGFNIEFKEGILEGLKLIKYTEKIQFKWKYIPNYFKIQFWLLRSTYQYVLERINLIKR